MDLKDDTFREMARAYSEVSPLRVSLSQMRLSDLAVGPDSHNLCLLSAFRARTGRNQPSNAQFIVHHKVKTTGFSRLALAAIIGDKEVKDGIQIWESYGLPN